jgi:hypothetical protein
VRLACAPQSLSRHAAACVEPVVSPVDASMERGCGSSRSLGRGPMSCSVRAAASSRGSRRPVLVTDPEALVVRAARSLRRGRALVLVGVAVAAIQLLAGVIIRSVLVAGAGWLYGGVLLYFGAHLRRRSQAELFASSERAQELIDAGVWADDGLLPMPRDFIDWLRRRELVPLIAGLVLAAAGTLVLAAAPLTDALRALAGGAVVLAVTVAGMHAAGAHIRRTSARRLTARFAPARCERSGRGRAAGVAVRQRGEGAPFTAAVCERCAGETAAADAPDAAAHD